MDYAKLSKTAQRLIKENGRDVTFIRLNTTPTDAQKPWRGNAEPRGAGAQSAVYSAVFVSPSSLGFKTQADDLFKTSTKICIVATPDDLLDYNEVQDSDNVRWKIQHIEKLKPGPMTMLYYVGVAR